MLLSFVFNTLHHKILEFLDEKVEQCGELCEIISIGSSYEGRDLKVLKVHLVHSISSI